MHPLLLAGAPLCCDVEFVEAQNQRQSLLALCVLERAALRESERVTGRAAECVEPWLPRLRARLGPGATDEQLLLHAFYDDALVAQLRDPVPECRFHTTPLEELVRHLASRRDIARARIRFAGVDLSFSS